MKHKIEDEFDPGYIGSVGAWRKRKRDWKKRVASHTAGNTKGDNCKASWRDKFYAKRSRSYKSRGYRQWIEKIGV